VQRRVISGLLAASIVAFAFLVCCASAPAWADAMQRRGCCAKHCRMVPIAPPSFFVTPIVHSVARPLSPQIALPDVAPPSSAAAGITPPRLFAPLETIQLRI